MKAGRYTGAESLRVAWSQRGAEVGLLRCTPTDGVRCMSRGGVRPHESQRCVAAALRLPDMAAARLASPTAPTAAMSVGERRIVSRAPLGMSVRYGCPVTRFSATVRATGRPSPRQWARRVTRGWAIRYVVDGAEIVERAVSYRARPRGWPIRYGLGGEGGAGTGRASCIVSSAPQGTGDTIQGGISRRARADAGRRWVRGSSRPGYAGACLGARGR